MRGAGARGHPSVASRLRARPRLARSMGAPWPPTGRDGRVAAVVRCEMRPCGCGFYAWHA
ncbi:hypothetical protein BU14_0135s0042 [Porphyra umbilicalis]|uniref:Uncharacterized protein n=1 Tax=Porphyra umbilicalis TaxID=2786 RepID=A0A1X6PA85_PORUM|nr:hypothetical protein BU14_0135s0042 [Porphyra umbilicalis]|eukprot:OSX77768.1 hypothetical protein BU14_0135s0042 [Porphyra umbilicalis]